MKLGFASSRELMARFDFLRIRKLGPIHVTLDPFVGDCGRGRLTVELDYLRELRAQERATHEAAEPKM